MEKKETTNMSVQPNEVHLQALIERLKRLQLILSQNSYVRDVVKRLHQLIEDAENEQMLLILGKERVGKTSLINALLGRKLLPVHTLFPTSANTFIRYGETECIKAIFLDGMVATFDLEKLELLVSSDNFGAQIIREHLDYLEVYVKHDMLKGIAIVDTTALEIGANNTAFFKPSLVHRMDDIFWVIRNSSPALEAEVNFLRELAKRNLKPYLIVNAIDQGDVDTTFIAQEEARYGQYIEKTLGVSALKAFEARKTNDMQLLIDSRYTELTQLIKVLTNNTSKKTRHITERFIHWLERLRKEIELIPQREPYISAYESVKMQFDDRKYEFSRQQRDLAILTAYEDEYRQVSGVFKPVQTLYQLLQVLASALYLRDDKVEQFEQYAIQYQQSVRDYRKTHSDYMRQYDSFSKHYQKRYSRVLVNPIILAKTDSFMEDRIVMLNELQQVLVQQSMKIEHNEQLVLRELDSIQRHLNVLAKKRLYTILAQVGDLNQQRKKEQLHLQSYINKLAEFTCITEAQSFLREVILPFMTEEQLPITGEEKQHIQNTIECICATDLTHGALYSKANRQSTQQTQKLEFDTSYTLIGLSLTKTDVVSTIPPLPEIVVVQ